MPVRSLPLRILFASAAIVAIASCGGSKYMVAPIVLTVSVNSGPVTVPRNGTPVYVPVTIVAPTETASFSISGLPEGLSYNYKESESNPSGQLTLTAASTTPLGTTNPVITVGSSGQTATTTFQLTITAPAKSTME